MSRPYLHNGRLVEPRSFNEGLQRREQLIGELDKIAEQIADPTRIVRAGSQAAYDSWHASALRARRLFEREQRLLTTWLAEHQPGLFVEAHALLRALRADLGDEDFNPAELALLDRLDAYFAAQPAAASSSAGHKTTATG